MISEFLTKKLIVVALIMTSLFGPAAYVKGQPAPTALAPKVSASGTDNKKTPAPLKFARTELYFGSDREDGPDVTEDDFRGFLDKYVTPEFPDGLTVLTGKGQFCCDTSNNIIRETSFVLILFYPIETAKESGEKIEKIRDAYKTAYHQQSVLRVDQKHPVYVSF
jgi:hypothetical protein